MSILTDGECRSLFFSAQQIGVHAWAENVHLTADDAAIHTVALAAAFGLQVPKLLWEMAGILDEDVEASAFRHPRHSGPAIAFRGLGCTLLVLCHELVHCWRAWEEPHHEDVDWDLCTIFLEERRGLV